MEPILSIVLPWYRKMKYFRRTLAQNRLYVDPRVEVIICMDESSEEQELLEFLKDKPGKFRVIVNDARTYPTEWRPPCKAINVGVRNSRGSYIAILSPESIVNPPTNEWLFRRLASFATSRFFLTGVLYNIEFSARELHFDDYLFAEFLEHRRAVIAEPPLEAYGWLVLSKKIFEELRGFDESRKFYAGDDDDFRQRLRMFGCTEHSDSNLRLIHLWHNDTNREPAVKERYGEKVILWDQENWGRDYSRIALDYA